MQCGLGWADTSESGKESWEEVILWVLVIPTDLPVLPYAEPSR